MALKTQKPALTPHQSRGDETRKRIADAAIAEFKRVGVGNANIGDIAREAGVSRPTFYAHFPTKEHVLLELQRSLEYPIIILMEHAEGLTDTLDVFVKSLMKARKSVGDTRLFSEMLLIYTRSANDLPLDDQPLMLTLAEKFLEAGTKGELRAGIPPEQAILLYLTGVFGYFIGPGSTATDAQCEEALRLLSKLYLSQN